MATIQGVYVALFGRPADPIGLAYWKGETNDGKDLSKIMDLAASPEYQARFVGQSNTQIVNSIYLSLFGHNADVAGLTFWVNGLNTGQFKINDIAIRILDGAQGTDKTTAQLKVDAADAFTKALDTTEEIIAYNGDTAAAIGRAFVAAVSTAAPSADAVSAAVANVVLNGGISAQLDLTIGTDTLAGSANNDVFVGGITLAPGTATEVNTLNAGDTLDGSTGVDTLRATINASVAPTLKNIENVEVRFLTTGQTLGLASSTGVERVSVVNTGVAASTVSGVGAAANFVVSGITAANASTVTFDGGTATKLNATFSDVGVVSTTAPREINVNFDDNKFTEANVTMTNSNVNLQNTTGSATSLKTLTVNATGTNELKLTAGAGSIETLNVSGGGTLDVSETATTALKTVTSTSTGGVSVNATGGVLETATTGDGKDSITAVGANIKNITTGAGNDAVSVVTSGLTASAVIDLGAGDDKVTLAAAPAAGVTLTGGEGTDTLAVAKADYATIGAFSVANRAKISGFETLQITNAIGTGDSIDLTKLTGITSFVAGAGVTSAETAAVTGVTSGSTVTLAGAIASNGALNVTVKDAATGTADTLSVVLNKALADDADVTVDTNAVAINLGISDVETISINSTGVRTGAEIDVNNYTVDLTNTALKTLTITGDQALTYTAKAGNTNLVTIDASANTAGVTINTADAALTQATTITGTAKADAFVLGNADVLNAGAGDDNITLGNLSKVTGGEGKDAFSINGVTITNGNTYGSITDFAVGETIKFTDAGNYGVALGTKITLAGTALFADYLQAAAGGTTAGVATWFQFNGNTYVVNDASATAAFVNGTDQVIELVGLLDLAKSTVDGTGLLTYSLI